MQSWIMSSYGSDCICIVINRITIFQRETFVEVDRRPIMYKGLTF